MQRQRPVGTISRQNVIWEIESSLPRILESPWTSYNCRKQHVIR